MNNINGVYDVFDTIGAIYKYMEGSPKKHLAYEKLLNRLGITKGKTALHAFSDTRWTARSDNQETILNVLPAVLCMLQDMSAQGDSATDGLLVRLQKFKFIVVCLVLRKCFALSRSLREFLQNEDMDLVSCVSGVQSLKESITSMRNDKFREIHQ